MNHLKSLSTAILTAACLISTQAFAQTPAEKTSAQITRNAATANPALASLSKNLFRDEQYQAHYTVQVPYQDTETYTVDVPYQDTETYTVQVPYQDTETYTENVPYTVSVPYTDTETYYTNENQCHSVTRYRQECHNEPKCYLVPGTGGPSCRDVEECGVNALGQRICKTRQVCDGGGSAPTQRCDNQQVCNNVPYNDQECSTVQVPHTRQVTKYRDVTQYRQETRTRTVTKYRDEQRTRTVTKTRQETRTREVTKYRDEDRCCVTKTRQVFDRQLTYNVEVVFPQEAVLADNEAEILNVKLISADANTAQVQVDIVNSIYGYKVASQSVNGASIQVVLALTPKYDLNNAGIATIRGLHVEYLAASQKFQISFTDSLNAPHVQSSYAIAISDLASGQPIEQLVVGRLANGQLGAVTTAALDSQAKIKATLSVMRQGVSVADSKITFDTSVNFEKRALIKTDVSSLSDAKLIGGQVIGVGLDASLQIIDQTPEFLDLATSYEIDISLKSTSGVDQPLKTTKITREALQQQGMAIKLASVFKSPESAQNSLRSGRIMKFTIRADRKGDAHSVLAGKTVQAKTAGGFTVP